MDKPVIHFCAMMHALRCSKVADVIPNSKFKARLNIHNWNMVRRLLYICKPFPARRKKKTKKTRHSKYGSRGTKEIVYNKVSTFLYFPIASFIIKAATTNPLVVE